MSKKLPIWSIIPELKEKLASKTKVILSAPTGSGKTTCVPPALLAEGWLENKKILLLEPRRLAARMAARRMAEMLNQQVGNTVGHHVRYDRKISKNTRIEVLTEGILVRRLQNDPELKGVGLVIFDEFHQRSIHADLSLALCLDVMAGLRDDLKILIMSATLEQESLCAFLDDAALVTGQGKSFPVRVKYLDEIGAVSRHDLFNHEYSFHRSVNEVCNAVKRLVGEETGDVLVFLPGAGEIRETARHLQDWAGANQVKIVALYGDLPKKEQDLAILPDPEGLRRIVLTTSIAETSLTIEGVRLVIDCGWSRVSCFDPNTGLSRLKTIRVSMAAAEQRRGRAGRLEPGTCCRLWREKDEFLLKPHLRPEIMDADLSSLALELGAWGVKSPGDLKWLDEPPGGHYSQAYDLLALLGAMKNGMITSLGKRMVELPVHPRLARMIIAAEQEGALGKACDLAALLSERDIIRASEAGKPSDLEIRLNILKAYRIKDCSTLKAFSADKAACGMVDKLSATWQKMLTPGGEAVDISAGSLLLYAYPDRVAMLRNSCHDRYLMANGRGVRINNTDMLVGSKFLVAAHLDSGRIDGRIFLAAVISEDNLQDRLSGEITCLERMYWDENGEKVVSIEEERFSALVLRTERLKNIDSDKFKRVMLEGVKSLGIDCLPWDKKTSKLRARIQWMSKLQPDDEWPDLSDASLLQNLDWLLPYIGGIGSRRQLAQLDMSLILQNMLGWRMLNRLDQEAPTHIDVPSGSRLPVQYFAEEAPVLAVRLQEMFGLADTPTIAGGKVNVVVHLLSPAGRPIQITRDLRGFWNNTYPEVKKELKGRYPKHHWPDDPWSAHPTARVKRKKK